MEVLFFIIFGGLLMFFFGYGIKLYREDKKILNEYKNQMDGHILGGSHLQGEEFYFLDCEQPTYDSYKSAN